MLSSILCLLFMYYCITAPARLLLERRKQRLRDETLTACESYIFANRTCKDPVFWNDYVQRVAREHKREGITPYDVKKCAYRLSDAYTPEGRDFLAIWCMMLANR